MRRALQAIDQAPGWLRRLLGRRHRGLHAGPAAREAAATAAEEGEHEEERRDHDGRAVARLG